MSSRAAGIDFARIEAQSLLIKFGVESAEHLRIEAFAARLGVDLVETKLHGARAQLVVGMGCTCILLRIA